MVDTVHRLEEISFNPTGLESGDCHAIHVSAKSSCESLITEEDAAPFVQARDRLKLPFGMRKLPVLDNVRCPPQTR
eukprot:6192687-Pleurochrysis_carterae.AAC.7